MKTFLAIFILMSAFAGAIRIHFEDANSKVGSRISIDLAGTQTFHSGIFLGRLVRPDGILSSYMFFDEKTRTVYYADRNSVGISNRNLQNILKLYDQQGNTCTSYAMNNLLHQMNLAGFEGNGKLKKVLATEEGRTQLLADAINQYYLVVQHRYSIHGIMSHYGKEFGFTCQSRVFDSSSEVDSFLQERLPKGIPVLISFNLGPHMVDSQFRFFDFDHPNQKVDTRLWVPRKFGQRNSGGHSVVVAAGFQIENRTQLLMLDSDWDEPRIWDFNEYFDEKTAIKEVTFVSCS